MEYNLEYDENKGLKKFVESNLILNMLPFPSEQPGDDTDAHFTYVRALRILSVDCSSGDRVVVLLRPG